MRGRGTSRTQGCLSTQYDIVQTAMPLTSFRTWARRHCEWQADALSLLYLNHVCPRFLMSVDSIITHTTAPAAVRQLAIDWKERHGPLAWAMIRAPGA